MGSNDYLANNEKKFGKSASAHTFNMTGSHYKESVSIYNWKVTNCPALRNDQPAAGVSMIGTIPKLSKKAIRNFKVSTYNVRSLNKPGRFDELCAGCLRYDIDFVSIQEHRWTTSNSFNKITNANGKFVFIYSSADNNGCGGIGILVARKYENLIHDITPISNRILTINFATNPTLTIICTHSPTNVADELLKEIFYEELQCVIQSLPEHNFIIAAGDFNAQIGESSHILHPQFSGKYTFHKRTNDNGERLVSLCKICSLIPTITKFKHPCRRQYTWIHPSGTRSQIDHLLEQNGLIH